MQESEDQISQLKSENKALQAELVQLRSSHQQAMERLQARLALEQAYQESQQRFQTIFEQSRLGSKIIAPDLRIIKVNQALAAMLGYEKAQLEGSIILVYAHPDYARQWQELRENLWTRQIPSFQLDTLMVKKDGSTIWCSITSILFKDEQEMLGYTIVEDISSRKHLEALEQEHRRLQGQQALLQALVDAQQQTLLQGIVDAQLEERRRISESLHNGVAQILYAAQLNLARVEVRALPDGKAEINQALEKTRQLMKEAIVEIRHVSYELMPILLKDFGLEKAIQEFCSRFASTGIELECHCFQERLSPALELTIYRFSQELLNNIIKHAGASRATIEVYRSKDSVYIEAQDNGKGMTSEGSKDVNHPEPGKGIGLKTIRDQVALLEGQLGIETTPGKGTLITIRLPYTYSAS